MKYFTLFVVLLVFLTTSFLYSEEKTIIEKQTIQIEIQPEEHLAKVEVNLQFKAPEKMEFITFLINKNVDNLSISHLDKELNYSLNQDFNRSHYIGESDTTDTEELESAAEVSVTFSQMIQTGTISLTYNLSASDQVDQAAFSREYIAYQVKGYIGDEGIFISPAYFWYPTIPGNVSQFDITAITPDTLQILTQGRLVSDEVKDLRRETRWIVSYPANSLHLVGSRYDIQKTAYKNIDIYTYFFPESHELAESYLTACVRYLALYENLIGPYPFSKFAVVENFFPTGYGMPSYTLLGSQVIRLPFIIYTSLGHEVAHNWWGNSVYVDYDQGNWCEGLTTYFADHLYKEQKSMADAVGYRRDINRDFTVYVKDQKDFPLNEFSERTESSSRAIGYGKSAMVFHQLRKILEDSLFFESFRNFYQKNQFKDASWTDIRTSVEQISGKNLEWFFRQWVERKGAPRITLSDVTYNDQVIRIKLIQDPDNIYRLYVPVKIVMKDSTILEQNIWLEKDQQVFEFSVTGEPLEIAVDPNFDFLRKLHRSEIPPSLSEIYAEEKVLYVLPDNVSASKMEAYKQFAETMAGGDEGASITSTSLISEDQLDSYPLYIMGGPSENSVFTRISLEDQQEYRLSNSKIKLNNSVVPAPDEVVVLSAKTSQSNNSVCIISIGENRQTGRVANLLSHYGKYSYLVFNNGKNQMKEIYSTAKSPMIYRFNQ
jgi:hypothetical protein